MTNFTFIFKKLLILGTTLTVFHGQIQAMTKVQKIQRHELPGLRHCVDMGQFYKADISFMIADIKFDGETVKFLEFGEGPRSKFKGYDALYGPGKIWTNFWYYLKQFNLPVWFVTIRAIKYRESFEKEIDFTTFENIGGKCVANLVALKKDPSFIRATQQTKNISNLSNYKGIAILNFHNFSNMNHNTLACTKCEQVRRFKKEHPEILVLDDTSRMYSCNKNWADSLFKDNQLSPFRPICHIYKKEYTPTLADEIISKNNADILVIKPMNAARGNGIMMIQKEDLNKTLELMLTTITNRYEAEEGEESKCEKELDYWKTDKNDHFMVESYAPSKPITVDNLTFDATMRQVFVLHYDKGRMFVTFIGGYWKLPKAALEEEGTLTEKIKSDIRIDSKSSEKISKEDMSKVQEILKNMLPPPLFENARN